jgi:hypothetical protein
MMRAYKAVRPDIVAQSDTGQVFRWCIYLLVQHLVLLVTFAIFEDTHYSR